MSLYEKIRSKKAVWEHEEVRNIIPFISEQLYSTKTQLIFELLQNAEDACTRLKRSGVEKKYSILFNLSPNGLRVFHNGIPFDDEDVDSICSVLRGTKTDDATLIGKFGIGFKSVYQFTVEPKIYSNNNYGGTSHNFVIKKFVLPYPIDPSQDNHEDETIIEVPFNQPRKSSNDAYKEIREKLATLDKKNLLFLKSIEEIAWTDGKNRGRYVKQQENSNGIKYVTLSDLKGREVIKEKWLVFEKHINDDEKQPTVEIAYKLNEDETSIEPIRNSRLYTYFETGKTTFLNFLIHGPFHTTPARDNIREDEWNDNLIAEISILVKQSMEKIKQIGLFDISYLRTLPINYEDFQENDFNPISETVKIAFQEGEYLPSHDGGFINSKQALLGTVSELRTLMSNEDLLDLYGKECYWLNEQITERRTPLLRKYLMDELEIPEITPESFGRTLTEDFLNQKNDEWLIDLYSFLYVRPNLWRKGDRHRRAGVFLSKPIIRKQDNTLTQPFDEDSQPLVFLPNDSETISIPLIKSNLAKDKQAFSFFKELGLTEPDKTDYIITKILPKYNSKNISKDENINDLKVISEGLTKSNNKLKKDQLLNKLEETKILYAYNYVTEESKYLTPSSIYLSECYSKENTLDIYFDGNNSIWFLDNRYLNDFSQKLFIEMGVNSEIIVKYTQPNFSGYVILNKPWQEYRRGVSGFDPDCTIDGLRHALRTITVKKSVIIWNLIKKYKDTIHGIIETSSRADYKHKSESEEYSAMGQLLTRYEWIPDVEGNFFKPDEIRLSLVHNQLDKNSFDSKFISRKLGMKPEIDEEIIEKMTDDQKKLLLGYTNLTDDKQKEILDVLDKLLDEIPRPGQQVATESVQEIREKFTEKIASSNTKRILNINDEVFGPIISPDEESEIFDKYGEKMGKYIKENVLRYRKILKSDVVESSRIPPKQFLIAEYGGHCQICNTKLDLGPTIDPIIDIYRIYERRNRHPWSDEPWNILGLCPNCHALAKRGGIKLQEVSRVANDIVREEVASSYISERNGQFYVINVDLAGYQQELYYSQRHMSYITAILFYDK